MGVEELARRLRELTGIPYKRDRDDIPADHPANGKLPVRTAPPVYEIGDIFSASMNQAMKCLSCTLTISKSILCSSAVPRRAYSSSIVNGVEPT